MLKFGKNNRGHLYNRYLKYKWWVGLVAIGLVWLVFVSPYIDTQVIPFPSRYLVSFFTPWSSYFGLPIKNNAMPDVITQIVPWRLFAIEQWQQGIVPLWNPYSFGGTIHAANYQSAVFFPLNILFAVLSSVSAWTLLVVLQPLLAGLSMLIYMKNRTHHLLATLLTSYSFMFCGFLTTWMSYATLGYAFLFVPLGLYAIDMFAKRSSSIAGSALSLVVAMSLLAGHFQIALYSVIVLLWYAISTCWKSKKQIGLLICYISAGFLLASIQILISVQAFLGSDRIDSFIVDAGIPLRYLITLFAPDFYGNPVTRNDWFGQYAEWATYSGVVPILLVGYLLLFNRRKVDKRWLIAGVVALLLVIAGPVSKFFYWLHIPVLSTSVATRLVSVLSLSIAILAGDSMVILEDDVNNSRFTRVRLKHFLIASGVIVCTWVAIFSSLSGEYTTIALRNSAVSILLLALFVGIVIGISFRRGVVIGMFLLVALTAGDMLRFANKWMPMDESTYFYPPTDVSTFLQEHISSERVFGNLGGEFGVKNKIPLLEGYDALYDREYGSFVSAASDGTPHSLERSIVKIDRQGKYVERLLDMMAVRYVVHKKSDGRNVWTYPFWEYPSYELVHDDGYYEVHERTEYLPRVYLVNSYRVIENFESAVKAVYADDFDPRAEVIVSTDIEIPLNSALGKITNSHFSSNEINITVDSPSSQIVVFSQIHAPGWNVYINDQIRPLIRANAKLSAVVVPEGTSEVRLRYEPLSFRVSLWLTGATLIALIATLVRGIYKV